MLSIDRVRVRGWVMRYLPLEVFGTISAVASAWLGYELSGSLVVAAIAGTLGESAGYYALVVARAARGHARSDRVRRMPRRAQRVWATTWLTARAVAAEFGPAELVDTFAVRPALLLAATAAFGGHVGGWLVGKLAADAVFYAVAIVSFELGRRAILPDGGHPPGRTRASGASARPIVSATRHEGALR
ncbi:hypothetical protein [Agromyces sp. Marseille-P2726]|uniref:hypothetical protein n=1 Tax=Agromyces sp. Marseille-P2726 TaxID=2709132 RepID=UPI00156FD75E|nr:hypothetical protein [Agromyces sp. Marseille-P2726]